MTPERAGRPLALKDRLKWLLVLLPVVLCLVLTVPHQAAAAAGQELWQSAVGAAEREDWRRAAIDFERLHREHPTSPFAEEALWRAATLRKKIAATEPDPDWERIRDLFRRFTVEYPDSPQAEEAYLEMGIAHFKMRFLREALTYFRLFVERYPDSELVPRARHWQARTLIEVARVDEAIEIFKELTEEPELAFRLEVMTNLGLAYDQQGAYWEALATFQELQRVAPEEYHLQNPEFLLLLGQAYFRVGREQEGYQQVFSFINLAPDSPRRPEALFELGESRRRQGEHETARRLYNRILEEGSPGERAVLLARFRLAEYQDKARRRPDDTATRREVPGPETDAVFYQVIERFGHEAIANDARYALYRRHLERDDQTLAREMARSYVRHAEPGPDPLTGVNRAGDLLVFLVEALLAEEEYQRVYQLYLNEFPHVVAYEPGRLRYLIGQALEELALYPQAAVVYYRALAGEMSREELVDLYYRRVEVYFAMADYDTADRLLAHLRRIYDGEPEMPEVYYLSGRLRAAEFRYDEALEFYRQAFAQKPPERRRAAHAGNYLATLEALARFAEMNRVMARFQEEQWLEPEGLQRWFRRTGDGLRRQGLSEQAEAAYQNALAEGLPTAGPDYQAANLYLGRLLAERREAETAREHLQAAIAGPDQMYARMAQNYLNQLEINLATAEMQSLFAQ
ncbi:tetratricopeptide repeat protein [Desulfurivibrio alkaliphilus]|uniref:tetratricopeptide repeat protein n=1 Tax=Desulfurivibrio alkaliphilus TaxID=427923 RepID=UPI00138A0A1B|nr:tetratricopeptide repeat protein [Desulfurivibrio alkaliphilus]